MSIRFRDPIGAHRNTGIPIIGHTWRDMHVQDDDMAGVIFENCTFERVRMERAELLQTIFVNSRLDDCIFDDCRLVQTQWIECTGSGLRISNGTLAETVLSRTRLSRLELLQAGRQNTFSESTIEELAFGGAGCDQDALTLSDCTLGAVRAESATWRNCTMVGVDLASWSMDNAEFDRCSFIRSAGRSLDLSQIRFESCNMYQSDLREARIRRAERSIFAECELDGTDFGDASLGGALFAGAKATGARFERACLDGALFPDATLAGACFAGATAKQSVWTGADLTGADLSGVDAFRASFRNAVLEGADVTNARLVETDLHGVEDDLTGADLRDSRAGVDWRVELEAQSRRGRKGS